MTSPRSGLIRAILTETVALAGLVAIVWAGFFFALAMDAPDPLALSAPDPLQAQP